MPIQPSPTADTLSPLNPNVLYSIFSIIYETVAI